MEDLELGNILLLIEDNSPWEFLRYSFSEKITTRAGANSSAKELFDKKSVHVKRIKLKTDLVSDTSEMDRPINLFRKAPADYIPN